jgi:hypothetical protein
VAFAARAPSWLMLASCAVRSAARLKLCFDCPSRRRPCEGAVATFDCCAVSLTRIAKGRMVVSNCST